MLQPSVNAKQANLNDLTWVKSDSFQKFFLAYADWSESLRSSVIDIHTIQESFSKVQNISGYDRNKKIVLYKLLTEAFKFDDNPYLTEYYNFLDTMRASGFWIEKAISQQLKSNENSFLAAQGFAYALPENDNLIKKINSGKNISRSRKNILNILNNIYNLGDPSTVFSKIIQKFIDPEDSLFDSQNWLDALSTIHFELTDNMDHWMNYPDNLRVAGNDPKFFGDTLVMEICFKYIPNNNQYNLEQTLKKYFRDKPSEYLDYALNHVKTSRESGLADGDIRSQGFKFVELSYFDNGRGIEENFKRFGKSFDYPGLHAVISNNKSTRDFPKAGSGFSKVIHWSNEVKGMFFIHSGSEVVSSGAGMDGTLKHRSATKPLLGSQFTLMLAV
jgi:hypothetical protein